MVFDDADFDLVCDGNHHSSFAMTRFLPATVASRGGRITAAGERVINADPSMSKHYERTIRELLFINVSFHSPVPSRHSLALAASS